MDILEENFKFAQDQMNSQGGLVPMLVVEGMSYNLERKRPVFVFPFTFDDMPTNKALFIRKAAEAVRDFKKQGILDEVVNIYFMSEAWTSTYNKDVDIDKIPMPRDDPKRKEVIMATWSDMHGNTRMKSKEIRRYILPEHPERSLISLEDIDMGNGNETQVIKNYLLDSFINEYKNG